MSRWRALVMLSVSGCWGSNPYEDLGKACLGEPAPFGRDTADQLVIAGDDAVPVTVVLSECSSGSTEWLDQSCTATLDGDRVVVTAAGATRTPRTQTTDCQWVSMDCGTVTLTEGDWTLVYGAGEEPFTVPYDGAPICAVNPS